MNQVKLEYERCSSVNEALGLLAGIVGRQNGGDANYFNGERNRYLYSIGRMLELCPQPCRVLDIGSHYLHQAVLLSLLGYEVFGVDIPFFTEAGFISERAQALKVRNMASERQQFGEFAEGMDGSIDLIVCTAFLEHIAFNPVAFWRRVWQLLSERGIIYLTTPNVFRLRALVKTLIRLLKFEGVGLPVNEVLTVITYGHHWKEYSCREIKKYFEQLSPDFVVETRTYGESETQDRPLSKLLETVPAFRTNIEAVIRLKGRTKFAAPPLLPMQAAARQS